MSIDEIVNHVKTISVFTVLLFLIHCIKVFLFDSTDVITYILSLFVLIILLVLYLFIYELITD